MLECTSQIQQIQTCEIVCLTETGGIWKQKIEWKSQMQQIQTCEIVRPAEIGGIWKQKIIAWVKKSNTTNTIQTSEIVCLTETCGIWINKITAWVYKSNTTNTLVWNRSSCRNRWYMETENWVKKSNTTNTNVWNRSSYRNSLYMEKENYRLSEKVKYYKYKRVKSFVLQKQVVYGKRKSNFWNISKLFRYKSFTLEKDGDRKTVCVSPCCYMVS